MNRVTTQSFVVLGAVAIALSACTSETTQSGPTSAQGATPASVQGGTPTGTQEGVVTPGASPPAESKEAWGDVKLGAITVDAKRGSPTAKVTITNHSTKLSNYVVDLSITTPDGKTNIDATIVSAEGLKPGDAVKLQAQFTTTQELPKDAKLTIVGVARLVA